MSRLLAGCFLRRRFRRKCARPVLGQYPTKRPRTWRAWTPVHRLAFACYINGRLPHFEPRQGLRDPPRLSRKTLANLTAPSCLVGTPNGRAPLKLTIEGGRIVAGTGERVDMKGRDGLSRLRRPPHPPQQKPDLVARPQSGRHVRLRPAGGRRRPHTAPAIRSHLDSFPPQHAISFDVFRELRDAWAGRSGLQAANLLSADALEWNVQRVFAFRSVAVRRDAPPPAAVSGGCRAHQV